jgi:hypothetical protein
MFGGNTEAMKHTGRAGSVTPRANSDDPDALRAPIHRFAQSVKKTLL